MIFIFILKMEFISVESNTTEVTENSVTGSITPPIENVENPTKHTETEEKTHVYEIMADYKKSTYATEHWTNQLSNGKTVTFLVTNVYRWGIFEIELTDTEKEEILKKETIVLNDYGVSCLELVDGWLEEEKIQNRDDYTEEELDEIEKLIYWHKDYYDDEYDDGETYDYNEDILELNGWELDDTIYGFDTKCELELISD